MIRACITLTVDPRRRSELIAALRSMVGPTQAELGCLQCSLYCDADDPTRVCLVEEWDSQANLRRRMRSKGYLDLLEIMELATCQPEVHFDEVSSRRGIELIHEERGKAP